jgi:hypothetical protein
MLRQPLPPIPYRGIGLDLVQTEGGDYVLVSTVHLHDELLMEGGLPWESMVFLANPEGAPLTWGELEGRSYDTEEQAREGHEELVMDWLTRYAPLPVDL